MEKELDLVTSLQVAKMLEMDDEYLSIITEQEIRDEHIKSEIEKTEKDFFDSDFVGIPI
jgi:hypothetical protein